jgi:hypothetical protein
VEGGETVSGDDDEKFFVERSQVALKHLGKSCSGKKEQMHLLYGMLK